MEDVPRVQAEAGAHLQRAADAVDEQTEIELCQPAKQSDPTHPPTMPVRDQSRSQANGRKPALSPPGLACHYRRMAPMSRVSGRALRELLPDVRQLPGPVYLALADSVTALVLDGRIATHTRLPSERELAGALRLSRATVTVGLRRAADRGLPDQPHRLGQLRHRPGRRRARAGRGGRPGSTAATSSTCRAPRCRHRRAVARRHRRRDGKARTAAPAATATPPPACCGCARPIAARFTARGVPTSRRPGPGHQRRAARDRPAAAAARRPGRPRCSPSYPPTRACSTRPRANSARVVPVPMAPGGGWQVDQLQATLRQAAPRAAVPGPRLPQPDRRADGRADPARRPARGATDGHRGDRRRVLRRSRLLQPAAGRGGHRRQRDHRRVAVQAGLGRPAHRLGPRVGGAGAPTCRACAPRSTWAARCSTSSWPPKFCPHLDAIAAGRITMLVPQRDALLRALHARLPQWRPTSPGGRPVGVARARRAAVHPVVADGRTGRGDDRAGLALRCRRHA